MILTLGSIITGILAILVFVMLWSLIVRNLYYTYHGKIKQKLVILGMFVFVLLAFVYFVAKKGIF